MPDEASRHGSLIAGLPLALLAGSFVGKPLGGLLAKKPDMHQIHDTVNRSGMFTSPWDSGTPSHILDHAHDAAAVMRALPKNLHSVFALNPASLHDQAHLVGELTQDSGNLLEGFYRTIKANKPAFEAGLAQIKDPVELATAQRVLGEHGPRLRDLEHFRRVQVDPRVLEETQKNIGLSRTDVERLRLLGGRHGGDARNEAAKIIYNKAHTTNMARARMWGGRAAGLGALALLR